MSEHRSLEPRPNEAYADPGVFERVCGRDALGGVHRQHAVDEVLRFRRHRVPLGRGVLQRKYTLSATSNTKTIQSTRGNLIQLKKNENFTLKFTSCDQGSKFAVYLFCAADAELC